jgi:DNA-binding YbaB/EbfC family protein
MANNPLDFLKMLQGVQKQMAEMQGKLADVRVTGTAGGDMVQVELTGNMEVVNVTLDPMVIDPQERSVLEDLIAAALGDALRKVREELKQQVGGGLNLPPGFPGV